MAGPVRFLRAWCLAAVALGLLVAGLNLLVDPYDVFGTPRIAGISLMKPAAKNHAVMAKTYQEARADPVTVVIGSSSAYLGIDASSPAWPDAMRPVYNYGIPGSGPLGALRTLQEAVGRGQVRNVMVFLDFQPFFNTEIPPPGIVPADPDEDERRYRIRVDGSGNPARRMQVAGDMFLALGTLGATLDSLKTIAGQLRPGLLNLFPDGTATESDFADAARADGMHDLFAQKNAEEVARARRFAAQMAGWQGPLPNLSFVSMMIAFAKAHGAAATFVISPHHYDAMEVYWRIGMWPRVEQMKAELAGLVAAAGEGFALWDFMDYSEYAIEAIPPAGDRRRMTRWFWEPTHYRKELGQLMLMRIFGRSDAAFGTRLTPGNVAAWNAQVRAERGAAACGSGREAALTGLAELTDPGCANR